MEARRGIVEQMMLRRSCLRRYLQAWEGLDVNNFVALLKEDATYTMPPLPQWCAGREAISHLLRMGFQALR